MNHDTACSRRYDAALRCSCVELRILRELKPKPAKATVNRHDILTEADRLTAEDRNRAYGPPLLNHQRIAAIWSVVLGIEVTPAQVALCMAGVKIARLAQTPNHLDSFIDGAAYMAIAGELACVQSEPSSPALTPPTATSSPSSSTTEPGMLTTLPGHSEVCCRTFPAETF